MDGEHRRIKKARNGPKTEKIDPHGKTTWPGLPHTGMSHDRVPLASLNHSLKQSNTDVSLPSPSLVQFRKG
ncbi:Nitric oxide synthase, salivary gland [Gossypium arboreum]|uniref:Nitric oxide synthase, salivary gland n=1 Tax=Gossypium arboreum TaxID=29729 RepID=A0A0B0PUA8_GOSAR|nr:Nitric oxide synthase, salivary gland [Gossypium arboreum]